MNKEQILAFMEELGFFYEEKSDSFYDNEAGSYMDYSMHALEEELGLIAVVRRMIAHREGIQYEAGKQMKQIEILMVLGVTDLIKNTTP